MNTETRIPDASVLEFLFFAENLVSGLKRVFFLHLFGGDASFWEMLRQSLR